MTTSPITTSPSVNSTYTNTNAEPPILEPSSPEARTIRAVSPTFEQMGSEFSRIGKILSSVTCQTQDPTGEPTKSSSPEGQIETGSPVPFDTAEVENLTNEERIESFTQNTILAYRYEFPNKETFVNTINALWEARENNRILFFFSIDQNKYYFKVQETEEGVNLNILKAFDEEGFLVAEDRPFSDIQHVITHLGPLSDTVYDSDDAFDTKLMQLFGTDIRSASPLPEEQVPNVDDLVEVYFFVKNSDVSVFETFPTRKEFVQALESLWKTQDKDRVVLSLEVDPEKYYFKFIKDTSDDSETVDCEILRISEGTAISLPKTDCIQFENINEAAQSFAPVFDKEYESAEVFNSQLVHVVKEYFKESTDYNLFKHFPNKEQFALTLTHIWIPRETNDTDITIGFNKDSVEYIFKFESNEDGTIDFDCLRDANGTIQIVPGSDCTKFTDITDAIQTLGPLFSKKEESEDTFFEQLQQIVASREEIGSKILSSIPAIEPASSITSSPTPSIFEYELAIASLHTSVKSENPAALQDAFETLQEMNFSTVLQIGDYLQYTPIGGVVLYYLNIIQLNETPDALNDDPDYAAQAFQNIEGCTSTADQRTRACLYAQTDMLFYALERALLEKDNDKAQKCIKRIKKVGLQMPISISSQLSAFQLDFTKGLEENLPSLNQTRNAMKQALNLP